jgi:hypothetical protein
VPGPVPGAAVPVRGMGVGAEERQFPRLNGGGGGAGAGDGGPRPGRRQGAKDGLSREGQEKVEVHLRLVPWRIRGAGAAPP